MDLMSLPLNDRVRTPCRPRAQAGPERLLLGVTLRDGSPRRTAPRVSVTRCQSWQIPVETQKYGGGREAVVRRHIGLG